MSAIPCALVLLAILAAAPAAGEIYRWTDAEGRVHFSQSLDQVPPGQRRAATEGASQSRPEAFQTYSTPAAQAPTRRNRALQIPFERHGHLMKVSVTLNDRLTAPFLVDTGASGIAVPRAIADRLGIVVTPSTPRVYVGTANGVIQVPVVELDSVQVGGARVEGLEATVNDAMAIGLLGGAFFNNFIYRVDAAAGHISLTPNEAIRAGLGQQEWQERFGLVRKPLAHLESYLEDREITRPGRRRELEERLEDLRGRLEELEREANRADVPHAWRQ